MRYYLIRDKQGNIVIPEFQLGLNKVEYIRTNIEKLKKNFVLLQYLIYGNGTAKYRKELYEKDLEEELEIIELKVDLEVEIVE